MTTAEATGMLGRRVPLARKKKKALGKQERGNVARVMHAMTPTLDERADPLAILIEQDTHRVAELVPIRHGRMSVSPSAFYRGGAAIMAANLAQTPTTNINVQLCGDAHLSNFGIFMGPDRRLVFDLNDFDETHPGPFEWDVKRLAASIEIAGRVNQIKPSSITDAVHGAVECYRNTINDLSRQSPLELHYCRVEVDEIQTLIAEQRRDREHLEQVVAKAKRKNSLRALDKLTDIVNGRHMIVPQPPLITRLDEKISEERKQIIALFDQYVAGLAPHRQLILSRYSIRDIARKVVGVGSVGTRTLIVLLESGDHDPLFMQLKEATPSALEAHLTPSIHEPAERVVLGQRLTQTMGDVLLGWSSYNDLKTGRQHSFYIRQLWDGKGSIDVEQLNASGLQRYAALCAQVLAHAHARSGDAALIRGYLGKNDVFAVAICEFARVYADLNEHDHAAHQEAISRGDIATDPN